MSLTQSQAKYNGLMPTVASKNQSHQNGLKIIKIINGKKKKNPLMPLRSSIPLKVEDLDL